MIQKTVGLGSKLQSLGINIEGLEDRVDSQSSDKASVELASNYYQVQAVNIEHFLKENTRFKRHMQALLSPAYSTRQSASKRTLGNSKESLDEACIDVAKVEISDTVENI